MKKPSSRVQYYIDRELPIPPNAYQVLLCGCTDCFTHAIFSDNPNDNFALKWANENSCNPEGFIIKHVYCELFDDE
jgi:hypothetical protein